MSSLFKRKISLGVVIGSRAFFSPTPCKAARDDVLAQLAKLGIDAVILPFEATANGAVQSIADADLYAAHFRAHADRIDGLVICLPNFGDEIAVAELVNRARLNVPILLAGLQRRGLESLRLGTPRCVLRQDQRDEQLLAIRRPVHRDDQPHLRHLGGGVRPRP
jgi:L-fucose isomerase-like protein